MSCKVVNKDELLHILVYSSNTLGYVGKVEDGMASIYCIGIGMFLETVPITELVYYNYNNKFSIGDKVKDILQNGTVEFSRQRMELDNYGYVDFVQYYKVTWCDTLVLESTLDWDTDANKKY